MAKLNEAAVETLNPAVWANKLGAFLSFYADNVRCEWAKRRLGEMKAFVG